MTEKRGERKKFEMLIKNYATFWKHGKQNHMVNLFEFSFCQSQIELAAVS